ncbi:MAG: hypothetical protein ACI901_001795 [Octadecabacter sp.]|jgi:hypothetical protein
MASLDGVLIVFDRLKPQNPEIIKWLTQKTIKQRAATLFIMQQLALVQS